jgi:hypothetical protein
VDASVNQWKRLHKPLYSKFTDHEKFKLYSTQTQKFIPRLLDFKRELRRFIYYEKTEDILLRRFIYYEKTEDILRSCGLGAPTLKNHLKMFIVYLIKNMSG